MHVRHGISILYMGEQFIASMTAAIDEARTLGLYMYLYDDTEASYSYSDSANQMSRWSAGMD